LSVIEIISIPVGTSVTLLAISCAIISLGGVPDAVVVDMDCELNRYLNELKDITPLNAENGLQFWLDRVSTYPRLSQLAEDLED
jgi:hypothetical protein